MYTHPIWKFLPKTYNDISEDPVQGDFFKSDESGSYNSALIRETIQNSLDAKNDKIQSGNVEVKITLNRDINKIKSTSFDPYIEDLIPHLSADKKSILKLPNFKDDIPYLLIEDHGTTGLEGDPKENDENENPGEPHDFYYFWRNVGRSEKNANERGRWGIGKAVFMRSSKINTYFGVTARASDNRLLLMGQSILTEHYLDGRKWKPYGYFGLYEDVEDRNYFALPISNESDIEEFQNIFNSYREKEDSGLSILIPYPDPEITTDGLAWAAIVQYFYPIMSGELSIEIEEEEKKITINKDQVQNEISKLQYNGIYTEENLRELVRFAQWAVSINEKDLIYLKEQKRDKKPTWSVDLFDEQMLPELRKRFDQGEYIAFRVPIKVKPNNNDYFRSHFDVFICKDRELNTPDVHFIRQGITITDAVKIRTKDIRALVIINDDPLSSMLGDAENVAHTKWEKMNDRFRDHYEHGPTCLSFVKSSISEITGILTVPHEDIDMNLLADVFSISNSDEPPANVQKPRHTRKKRGKGLTPGVPEIPKGKPRMIEICKEKNGFTIRKYPSAIEAPVSVDVRLAYDVGSGNPFKKYKPADFDLSKMNDSCLLMSHSFVKVEEQNENHLSFKVTNPGFSITLTGFDGNRDLIIDAKPKRGES